MQVFCLEMAIYIINRHIHKATALKQICVTCSLVWHLARKESPLHNEAHIYTFIYIHIYTGIDKNVSFFRCSAAAKYFAAKILYPKLFFAAALLNFAAILLSTESDPNSCGPMADGPFRDPKGRSYLHLIYWTHRWRFDINIDHGISPHRAQLRESGHMTYHTTALLPNSCGPMADGPFRDPKGRS